MNAEEANILFDKLVGEIYFGFNMRLVMINKLTTEEVTTLGTILIKCQRGRMKLSESRRKDDPAMRR